MIDDLTVEVILAAPLSVEVDLNTSIAVGVVVSAPLQAEVALMGVAGPPGKDGAPGPAFAPQVYHQTSPSASWPIPHGLGRLPGVSVVVAGEQVLADVYYPDLDNVNVVLAEPTPGYAVIL